MLFCWTAMSLPIAAGRFHTCAIHDGIAKCWGGNGSGQLGVGELADGDDADTEPDTSALTPQNRVSTLSFE